MSPEISDLIVDYDPTTLARRPVRRSDVTRRLLDSGNTRAAAIARALPVKADDILDERAVDNLLLRVHAELQRLNEEFQQGLRVLSVLRPFIAALRAGGFSETIRVVDIGCGLGYVIRWLAAFANFGADIKLIGCDYNRALVDGAARLARAEDLRCEFHTANAFQLEQSATVILSTGVIHHFRDEALGAFFKGHEREGCQGFIHYDIAQTWLSPLGAWIFHIARMREPLSRHDGVLSAIRAHSDDRLLEAASSATSSFALSIYDRPWPVLPLVRVLRPIIGLRPQYRSRFEEALGNHKSRLGPWSGAALP